MTTDILVGPLGELRSASTAGGGTALTSSATIIAIPDGTSRIFVTPTAYAGALVVGMLANPYLGVVKTTDDLAALANATDYSDAAQDAQATTLVSLDAFDLVANNNFLYIGSKLPFGGVKAVVSSANAIASALAVRFWNGTVWGAPGGLVDGSASGGATFAQTGHITWNVPATWVASDLHTIRTVLGTPLAVASFPFSSDSLYWMRLQVSAQLSAGTALSGLLAINRATNGMELLSGQTFEERIRHSLGGLGCLQFATDAGTANVIVNVASNAGDTVRILP